MRTIDKVIRRAYTGEEKQKLIDLGISNGVGSSDGFKFTEFIRDIISDIVKYFPNIDTDKINELLNDFDRLANEGHDPDYYEGYKWYEKIVADYRFAKGGYHLLNWTYTWIRIIFFLIAFIGLTYRGGDAYNREEKKYIKDILCTPNK